MTPERSCMWLSRAVSLAASSQKPRSQQSIRVPAVPGEKHDRRIDITRAELMGRVYVS